METFALLISSRTIWSCLVAIGAAVAGWQRGEILLSQTVVVVAIALAGIFGRDALAKLRALAEQRLRPGGSAQADLVLEAVTRIVGVDAVQRGFLTFSGAEILVAEIHRAVGEEPPISPTKAVTTITPRPVSEEAPSAPPK